MFLKLHRVLLLGLIFIALFSCGTVAYGADLETYKAKADEIKTEISALEVEVEACQKNKDFAHQLAQYARRIGADEEDSAIVRARSIWTFNDEREEELQKKLDLLYKELEEYDFYANMSYIGDFKLTGYCACNPYRFASKLGISHYNEIIFFCRNILFQFGIEHFTGYKAQSHY